ncbi:putative CC2D2A, C2 domain-containing protein [Plasmopara halstedii]
MANDHAEEMELRPLTDEMDSSKFNSQNKTKSSKIAKRNTEKTSHRHQHDYKRTQTNNRFLRTTPGQSNNVDFSEPDGDGEKSDNNHGRPDLNFLTHKATVISENFMDKVIVNRTVFCGEWFQHRRSLAPAWHDFLKQLRLQEVSGRFVCEKKKRWMFLGNSTLDRLEERFEREFTVTEANGRNGKQERPDMLIKKLLSQSENSLSRRPIAAHDDVVDTTTVQLADAQNDSHDLKNSAPTFAILKLFLDRIMLDDHPTFTVADRLTAQLRALYRAYNRMQQLQPWQLSLQRLEDFYFQSTNKPERLAKYSLSTKQLTQELQQLVINLEALNQLHFQILTKVEQLHIAETHSGTGISVHIKRLQRKQLIDLSRVGAVVGLLESYTNHQQNEAARCDNNKQLLAVKQLSNSLSSILSASAYFLQTVLQLKENRKHQFSLSESSSRPQIYVIIRVNGKIACKTKVQACNHGEVRFFENLSLTVPFFPSSIFAEVYERRKLMRDKILSTGTFPMLIPGQTAVRPVAVTRQNFEEWRDDDVKNLVPVASITPSDEWYEFGSTTSISRKRWHSSFDNELRMNQTNRYTHGRLHLRMSWVSDQQNSSMTAYLPPKRLDIAYKHDNLTSKVQLIGKSASHSLKESSRILSNFSFSEEEDCNRVDQSRCLNLDPINPDNMQAQRLQRDFPQQKKEAQVFDFNGRIFFQTSNEIKFFAGSGRGLTKRNRLIQIRDQEYASRHGNSVSNALACQDKVGVRRWEPEGAVFDEPLPLLEHELLTDKRLLRHLRPELRAFDRRLLYDSTKHAEVSIVQRYRVQQLVRIQDFRERVRQAKRLSNLNTDQITQEGQVNRPKPLTAIVQENPLPMFPGSLDLSAIKKLLAPRRRLRPRLKVPAPCQSVAHWPTACTLYIQLHKAINVPVRVKRSGHLERTVTTGSRHRNLLQRMKKSPRMLLIPSSGENDTMPREDNLLEYESHIFVQINFQGKVRQTTRATIVGSFDKQDDSIGANASWMETVAFPFHPPRDDWSPDGIESTREVIRFSIFDQVTRPASMSMDEDLHNGEEQFGSQTRALHRENCFLGSLEIPFLTVYQAGRFEGSLRCQMPVEHLGYANLSVNTASKATSSTMATLSDPPSAASSCSEAPQQLRSRDAPMYSPDRQRRLSLKKTQAPKAEFIDSNGSDGGDELKVRKVTRESTLLKVTLLLDPALPVNTPTRNCTDSIATSKENSQNKAIFAHAQRWITNVKSSAPANAVSCRNYNVFVRNLKHGATFLSQFLRAQSPPKELQDAPLLALVHYVSLIPSLDDCVADTEEKDVWNTSHEVLAMGAGDNEEHAVLLANYFMWYDHRYHNGGSSHSKIYLVFGNAIPDGNIVYVLREQEIWNARTGVGYAISDPHCPLRDVSLVASSTNVFANIQPLAFTCNSSTGNVNWNIENNLKCWKPFFSTDSIIVPLPSVQHRKLVYRETSPEFVNEAEVELKKILKLAVRRWRSTHFATIFNEAASLQLRNHLIMLECEATNQNGSKSTLATPTTSASKLVSSPRATTKLKQEPQLTFTMPVPNVNSGVAVLREMQRSHEVCGIPLHLSLTNIPQVLKIVQNTVQHPLQRTTRC